MVKQITTQNNEKDREWRYNYVQKEIIKVNDTARDSYYKWRIWN